MVTFGTPGPKPSKRPPSTSRIGYGIRSGPERISSVAPVTSSASSWSSCRVVNSKIIDGRAPTQAWTQSCACGAGQDLGLAGAGRDVGGDVLDLLWAELSAERRHPASAAFDFRAHDGVR